MSDNYDEDYTSFLYEDTKEQLKKSISLLNEVCLRMTLKCERDEEDLLNKIKLFLEENE